MRILSVVRKRYYGSRVAIEPMYLYFTVPLSAMGHEVEVFDHYEVKRTHGKTACTEKLIETIRSGNFSVVFYQTSGKEPIQTEELSDISRKTCIAAWNSDDDWQWETTREIASHFTFMITTYPAVYEQNRHDYQNLLLSQWGCLGIYSNFARKKDIEFSFAGALYGIRNNACRFLNQRVGLRCFGRGSRLVKLRLPYFRGAFKLPWLSGDPIDFKEINDIWNRSKVSYTPMSGGPTHDVLSVKSRVFDMGLSGTLMLCEHSPNLEQYYEPGEECITFESLEDCVEKAKWYLSHENERAYIADLYRERTLKEHLWEHRFATLFRQMELI